MIYNPIAFFQMCGTILTYEVVLIDMVDNDSLESSQTGAK